MSNSGSDSSDTEDDEYRPDKADAEELSEQSTDDEVEDDQNNDEQKSNGKSGKRSKNNVHRGRRKKLKNSDTDESQEKLPKYVQLTEEEEKKKSDDLWANFLGETKSRSPSPKRDIPNKKPPPPQPESEKKKIIVSESYDFAGEEITVTKEIEVDVKKSDSKDIKKLNEQPSSSLAKGLQQAAKFSGKSSATNTGGLGSLLGRLGKKQKISTLEKSKLDWDNFKSVEGIEEEIQTHNKGKDG